MNLPGLFNRFHLEKVRVSNTGIQVEVTFKNEDKAAAWELYVELLTRSATQPLPEGSGNEQAALVSVYSIFPSTREILRARGPRTIGFSKVAIPVLNQVIRPFTTKWHSESQADSFGDVDRRAEFREELAALQEDLRRYNSLLAHIAGVEDLTELEQAEDE